MACPDIEICGGLWTLHCRSCRASGRYVDFGDRGVYHTLPFRGTASLRQFLERFIRTRWPKAVLYGGPAEWLVFADSAALLSIAERSVGEIGATVVQILFDEIGADHRSCGDIVVVAGRGWAGARARRAAAEIEAALCAHCASLDQA
jgi:hypothetical protein